MSKKTILAAVSAIALLTGASAQAGETDSYAQGIADWQSLAAWFNSQTGDRAAGVQYWAANRNVSGHLSCGDAASNSAMFGDKAVFADGCQEAKRRLDPIDDRRHADPQYRLGFSDAAKRLALQANATVPSGQAPATSAVGGAGAEPTVGKQPEQRPTLAAQIIPNVPHYITDDLKPNGRATKEPKVAPPKLEPVHTTTPVKAEPAKAEPVVGWVNLTSNEFECIHNWNYRPQQTDDVIQTCKVPHGRYDGAMDTIIDDYRHMGGDSNSSAANWVANHCHAETAIPRNKWVCIEEGVYREWR